MTTLPEPNRDALDRLFAAHPRLRVAWDALQELYGLYQANDLQGALDALQRFADLYETGQIPEYHNTVDTILNWSDEILNWHHSRRSNGPLEGTNNLVSKPSAEPPTLHKPPKLRRPRTPPNMNPTTNQLQTTIPRILAKGTVEHRSDHLCGKDTGW